ncbi:MAG: hypothetical protein AB7F59_03860 [Bdellovibrionales bacterium]
MINETQMKSVALFFFYAFMEESVATAAISKSLRKIERSLRKGDGFSSFSSASVYWTEKVWSRYNKKKQFVNLGLERMFSLPKDVELEPWKQLQKDVLPEEYLAAIWTGLLQYPPQDIAEGLGVSVGTVQHRSGIALKKLGLLLQSGKLHAKKRT